LLRDFNSLGLMAVGRCSLSLTSPATHFFNDILC
jgi:hypothetical protein